MVTKFVDNLLFKKNKQITLFTAVIVGGIDMYDQALMLAKKPHVLIGECFQNT